MARSIVDGMQQEKLKSAVLPAGVRHAVAAVTAAGGRIYLVGGSVRDLLRGEPVVDFDLATDLPPPRLQAALPQADARDLRLGALALPLPGGQLTVTTLREESDYQDHRRPQQVRFVAEPALDAVRRDFTVNALYWELQRGVLLDPCGGLADLERGVLRCIGEPRRRFTEDPLRLLRAVRFLARLSLAAEPATAAALAACAGELRHLQPERAFAELTAMFTGERRGEALALLVRHGLAAVLLPEVAAMDGVTQPPEFHPEGDVLTHCCLVLQHVPAGDAVLAWAAVLHDVGKPPTWRQAEDRIRFDGHDVLSADMAAAVLDRLRAGRALRDAVVAICRDHIRFAALPGMRPVRAQRWMRQPDFDRHLAFHRADCLGSHGKLELYELAAAQLAALPPEPPAPWLSGRDVLALGVGPGPRVGELLRQVDAAMNARCDGGNRAAALQLLAALVDGSVKPVALPADKDGEDSDR